MSLRIAVRRIADRQPAAENQAAASEVPTGLAVILRAGMTLQRELTNTAHDSDSNGLSNPGAKGPGTSEFRILNGNEEV